MKLNSTSSKINLLLNKNDKLLQSDSLNNPNNSSNNILKYAWIIAGTIFTCLGILGIILPVLPTTPFILLAAFCYGKSSKRFYRWLLNNRWLGVYIKNYREKKGIPLRTKIISIAYLWLSLGVSAIFLIDVIYGKIIMSLIGTAVTIYIINLKTLKLSKEQTNEF